MYGNEASIEGIKQELFASSIDAKLSIVTSPCRYSKRKMMLVIVTAIFLSHNVCHEILSSNEKVNFTAFAKFKNHQKVRGNSGRGARYFLEK